MSPQDETIYASPAASAGTRFPLLLGLCCMTILALFAGLGYFAFPIADDLSYSLMVKERGLGNMLAFLYQNGSGRYFSNIMFGISGLFVENLTLYHLTASFHILLLILSMRALIGASHKGNSLSAWVLTLCLSAAFITALPSPSQGLYWQCGSLVYFLPFNALFAILSILAAAAFSPNTVPYWHYPVLYALLIIVMGSNEITAIGCAAIVFFACLTAILRKHPRRSFFMHALIAGTLLILPALLAPGNFNRMEGMEAVRPWEWKFLLNAAGGSLEGYKWYLRTPMLPAIAVCCLFFTPTWMPKKSTYSLSKRIALILIIGSFFFFGEFLLVYISSKRAPYARIMNAIFTNSFLFLLAATVFFMNDLLVLRKRLINRFGYAKLLGVAGAATIIAMLLQPTTFSILRNLANGEFAAYRMVWIERIAKASNAHSHNTVISVPALKTRPFPLVFRDLEEKEEKHQWVKGVFVRYYGLKGIELTHQQP